MVAVHSLEQQQSSGDVAKLDWGEGINSNDDTWITLTCFTAS